MKLDLYREPSGAHCTLGKLHVDGDYYCETLEDVVRDVKIPHETAIPAGTYAVVITVSPRFRRELPLLVDVPEFTGVRIHPGNTDADTDGCILVGQNRQGASITSSRLAFEGLFDRLKTAITSGEKVTLEIHPA